MWEHLAQMARAWRRDLARNSGSIWRGRGAARSSARAGSLAPVSVLAGVAVAAALTACESAPPGTAEPASEPPAVTTAGPVVPERPSALGDAAAPRTARTGVPPPTAGASAPSPASTAPSHQGAPTAGNAPPAVPAPPPARSESNGYAIHWQRPAPRAADDGVEVIPLGWLRGVRLLVTSSGGIGQVEVRPARGGWPNQVQVEFRHAPDRPFEVLEGVRFQVINPAHMAGDEVPPLAPDDFVVWQRDGRFWFDLPSGWLRRQQALRIAWVDVYRR